MKTSVIRYRVADFLRQSPPFDVISLEDLLEFSGLGRVVFHEDDIYLFRKGEAREAKIWVMQQGKVEMLDELPAGELLRDVLGPGDILGLRRDAADEVYKQTARTATDVILYAFDLSAFETLIGKYPESARFLTAHISAAAQYTKALQMPVTRERLLTEKEKTVWLNASEPSADWLARKLVTCKPTLSIRDAAKQMIAANSEAVVVVAANGSPLGLITDKELREEIAQVSLVADTPVELLMTRHFTVAPASLRIPEYWMEMLRNRCRWLVITQNGLASSPLQGLISDADLEIACGKNPALLLREMLAAESVEELAYLWQRAEDFLRESLVGPSVIEPLSQMLNELRAALIERVLHISEVEMTRTGQTDPGLPHSWLLFGDGGRRELLTPTVPEIGLVYADPHSGNSEAADKYFSTVIKKVAAKLEACGLQATQSAIAIRQMTLSGWKEFYRAHITDPIGSQIYSARDYFDVYIVAGEAALGTELQEFIVHELAKSDVLIPILANDTIANLPPLTFHQGSVLEADGRVNQTLDIEKAVLLPITDAARVLALTERSISSANTLQRLQQSAKAFPQHKSILTDAAEAWRIVSYHHALAWFARQDEAVVVYPARLNRFEQRLLKTAFDSTRRFLDLVSSINNLSIAQ